MTFPFGKIYVFVSLWITLSFCSQALVAQDYPKHASVWVDSVLGEIRYNQTLDAQSRSDLADTAYRVSLHEKDICRQTYSRILHSISLDQLGLGDSALHQLYHAQNTFAEHCDSMMLFNLYANLTNVLLTLGELNRVDSIGEIALSQWNADWRDNETRFMILNNVAIANVLSGDTLGGLDKFREMYQSSFIAADTGNMQSALINLGTIKGMADEPDSAYYYFSKASDLVSRDLDIVSFLDLQYNLARIDILRKKYLQAENRLDSLFVWSDQSKNVQMLAATQQARADLFANQQQYKKAYEFLSSYMGYQEHYLNEERIKAVTEMLEKYEAEKKARQIQELELANLDAHLKNEKIRNTRNKFLFIGSGILLVALGLVGRLRLVHKSKTAIQKEKDVSEGLLLNILPAAVADELKIKGQAEAKLYHDATILFSDFVGFTTIAGNMSPSDLVSEINTCFTAFDEIMGQYGLEKIKTIGDAYMAAGAVPETNKATAADVIRAALAMQHFIVDRKKQREALQLPGFEMRIGIHTGPVVAGIVGSKKFQYDLWGHTVNLANRLESAGIPGKVNISAATYHLIATEEDFACTDRGVIEVKGMGGFEMFLVAST